MTLGEYTGHRDSVGTTRGIYQRHKPSCGKHRCACPWGARYHDEYGREHKELVGPKALALKVYRRRRTEIAERRFFPEAIRRRDVLVADAIEDYFARNASRLRGRKEWERIGRTWADAPETCGKTLREVTTDDLERARERMRAAGLAVATCNRRFTLLRMVYRSAIRAGLLDRHPVVGLIQKENNARVRYLTDDEERRLRAAVAVEHWPPIAVAMHTGFRQANVFRLRWSEDVDFAAGTIRAHQPKGGEDYHVPMNDELRAELGRSRADSVRRGCSRTRPAPDRWTRRTTFIASSTLLYRKPRSRDCAGTTSGTVSPAGSLWPAWTSKPCRS